MTRLELFSAAGSADSPVGPGHQEPATSSAAACEEAQYTPEQFTQPFCDFMTECPTAFHVVEYSTAKLRTAGFQELPTRQSWAGKIHPGGKYWTTRNGSALVAFTVGAAYKPGSGIAMVAGHIDANTAKLKPVSAKPVNEAGCIRLGVAPYAAGLNKTWWDRDLGIGGRVIVTEHDDDGKRTATSTRLVKLDWPVAKVATLAAHLERSEQFFGDGNQETRMAPIIGLASAYSDAELQPLGEPGSFVHGQSPELVRLIAGELGVSYTQIVGWDLELYDFQPAQVFGMRRELISAGRLDDKLCSWAALTGLLMAKHSPGHDDNDDDDDVVHDVHNDDHHGDDDHSAYVKLVSLFDDEEIGSQLRQGAASRFLPSVIERALQALAADAWVAYGPGLLCQTYARSFLIASDVSHAGHPNFLDKYAAGHVPTLNTGIAVKHDPNGGFSSDAVSAAVLMRVGEMIGARTQLYQARSDVRAGSSIGPMMSAMMGCRSTDAGLVQLSMHSVRATTGALDPGLGALFYKGFLENWEKIDGEFAA